jgi:hypothetical protein
MKGKHLVTMPEPLDGIIAADKVTVEKWQPKHKRVSELAVNVVSQLFDECMDECEGDGQQKLDE